MGALELGIAAAAIAAAYLLVKVDPELAGGLLFARQVVFGAFGLMIALILIATGVPTLMFVGALGLFFVFLYTFREQPHRRAV